MGVDRGRKVTDQIIFAGVRPEILRDWRLARGITQADAARLMGVGLRSWELYEQRGCTVNFWRSVLWVSEHGAKLA